MAWTKSPNQYTPDVPITKTSPFGFGAGRRGRMRELPISGVAVPQTGAGSGGATSISASPGTTNTIPWRKYALIAVAVWLAWHFMGKVKI